MAQSPQPAFGKLSVWCNTCSLPYDTGGSLRRKREFIPNEKKDTLYWEKRQRNNEAARRSRERRRFNDLAMANQVLALEEENLRLRVELWDLKAQFGLISFKAHPQENSDDQVYFPLQTQDGWWFRGTNSLAPDFTYKGKSTFSRELFRPNLENIPSVRQYNFSTQQARSLKFPFSPNYLNYHLLQSYSCFLPSLEDSQFPKFLPNLPEAGTEVPRNTSKEDVEQWTQSPSCGSVDSARSLPMGQNYSALPHKLRIKTKYVHFWDCQSINGQSKPMGTNVVMKR